MAMLNYDYITGQLNKVYTICKLNLDYKKIKDNKRKLCNEIVLAHC